MLTLDAVRAAVLSDQPWRRLDELVRAEQSSGRKVKEIYDALADMADEINRTPGLTEDGSDAFGDTLDALTGHCREQYQYKDPPNTTLPTGDEIAKLPRWVRVSFAARCARYGESAWCAYYPDESSENRRVVAKAIQAVERMAASGRRSTTREPREHFTDTALQVFIRNVVLPAYDAAWEAWDAQVSSTMTGKAVAAAAQAITFVMRLGEHPAIIRRDFDHLARLAEAYEWTDDTPVSPEVFGPLWPEGPPKGWPNADVPARAELAIEAFARNQATEQMVEDDVVNLFNALNRYHIARSGVRLTLEQFRSLLPSLVPAEA
jgi:hypothetical protein